MAESEVQRYKGKVTIVTGGSKGIGKGCVEVFVKHGSKVVFCARGEKEGKELEAEMNKRGPGETMFLTCDVSKEADIKNVVAKTVEKYGRIDCLINNAGQHPPHTSIDDISADDFRRLLDVNIVSIFLFSKFALPHLRKTKGNIINASSLVGQIGQPGATTYVSTKGAITSFTKALAVDEAVHGVRVNVFSPGNVWTPMWENEANSRPDPEACRQAGADAQLVGRYGTLEESGLLCLYLAADATFCTGIDVNLSGGAELDYGYKNKMKTSKKDT
ncbi:17-beta-hydroxysteroid dehydrogenase 14-like [Mizuhopecten yessoensis]|uniref:17-beta-hydroxysteroid dehydrogenase 14 n=1 Tax=Mizuhopecten yessoensis TaxID=6573 RepID=A0A210QGR5_MIZYE|nr:17-beta-hydroxysteroid dehydrogenase 14-like [Mizuhopecten yessoensis]OWF47950.1 17-beta-hydroxysteroid dehydrogenase 14 [Mizuhopecten yessoensis]